MPNNSTRKTRLAKIDEPKRLATTPQEWTEATTLIREHVERIASRYDDREQAESLYLLIDLISNPNYFRVDRDLVASIAKDHAFSFTDAFHVAQKITLGQIPQGTELRMVM